MLIRKHYDILAYLFFGVLTTAVNYIVYLPCYNLMHFSAAVSNVIAWVVAVAFAYLTNKPFVFKSHDWSPGTVVPELTKFVTCRIGSGGGSPRSSRRHRYGVQQGPCFAVDPRLCAAVGD